MQVDVRPEISYYLRWRLHTRSAIRMTPALMKAKPPMRIMASTRRSPVVTAFVLLEDEPLVPLPELLPELLSLVQEV